MATLEESHWWYRGLHDLVTRVVAAERDRKGKLSILDAGCGTGRLCRLLESFGTVTGCDSSDLALQLCRENGIETTFKADLNCTDLGRECYDVITCMDVLYHRNIEREDTVLTSFYRALRPGGTVLLNLVAFESLRSSHDIAVYTRRRYRRHEVVQLLQEAGFTIRFCSYRLCLLFPLLAAYRSVLAFFQSSKNPDQVQSDLSPPPRLINRLLKHAVCQENRILGTLPLPFGLSVFAVAEKPDNQGQAKKGVAC